MALGDINTTKLNASGIMSTRDFIGLTVGSFEVKKLSYSDEWYSTINQGILLGYGLPSQDDALALLHGVMLQKGGGESQVNAAIQEMIADGRGIIESDITEVILDTYILNGNTWRWRSSNNWWNGLTGGLGNGYWTSTNSETGTYLKVDRGSRIEREYIMFSADDPDQTIGGTTNPWVKLIVTPSSGGSPKGYKGINTGAGDSRWYWVDEAGNTTTFTTAQIENGGTFGWDQSDSIQIQIGKG
tara:strand:- start:6881 stop:7609 length:729 start_codon:yes stop_codon:yes gene_type:complete